MLNLRSIALLCFVLAASVLAAHAAHRPRPLTAAETEARNETAAPGLSGQLREARRVARVLADALTLTDAQQRAVESLTGAARQAQALAATPDAAAQARQEYRRAVQGILSGGQRTAYAALCQRLAGTAQALDGPEVAAR